VRVRRADHSNVEWIRANGTLDQFRGCVGRAFRGLPVEVFDELFEADERGLAPETLAVVESIASTIAPGPADGECAVCMEPLDALGSVGGFAKLRVAQLPCAHRFHLPCYSKWAARRRRRPSARATSKFVERARSLRLSLLRRSPEVCETGLSLAKSLSTTLNVS